MSALSLRTWGALTLAGLSLSASPRLLLAADTPPLMLANSFSPHTVLANYWISEKLDGVRAYWDGKRLLSRSGNAIEPPSWFTAGWPQQPLDGELWMGRGQFAALSGTVRQLQADDSAWRKVHFMVYDLPAWPGDFNRRDQQLSEVIKAINQPWVQHVEQQRVNNLEELHTWLANVEREGGEGLMLKRGESLYHASRSDDLLKYKRHQDAEAEVIGYIPGKGKYTGMVGALLVRNQAGLEFRLGSGLSDAERREPPPLGSQITYRYDGTTKTGVPRFARFLRMRIE
ncbi:DNA ligase [Pokkaliibacter sp. MBI-7]|uniref:DNA ligase n=1 Tax=Pokkaliibacter sp. MBI-7 TaxID=3040600 RepID=UPI002449243A|nr:DNA ligase [Pokkaliibacter sp. MBI-7]MDH2432796.1 DNA ligase [Pokkaliibacter sp. MBI-7]